MISPHDQGRVERLANLTGRAIKISQDRFGVWVVEVCGTGRSYADPDRYEALAKAEEREALP